MGMFDCEENGWFHPDTMTPNKYQKLAMRTAGTPELFGTNVDGSMDDILHALLGIGTEAGELQDMLKKHLMYGKPFDRTNLVEECGDLLWYIAFALKSVNVTMEDCMTKNIEKLKVRYPKKFTTEKALNRDLAAEAKALDEYGLHCSVCGERQFGTTSGITCANGHGGAEPLTCLTDKCGERALATVKPPHNFLVCKQGHLVTVPVPKTSALREEGSGQRWDD